MLKVVSSSSRRHSVDRFVPLKNISVQVNIHAFAAEVCIKQIFINSEETVNPIEAVYCFPVEESAAIYSFEANLDDGRKIQAQIKEKKAAQQEYCKALKQGHGAFLLEQDEKSNDIFTISIGSLKPQSKCEIEIRYVQELELIDDGQRIQFILPTTIAPRYSSESAGHGHIKSPGLTTSKYVQSAPYTISFSCSISSLPIASIGSPSHPIQVTTANPTMEVSLVQENTHLDRDIILNIDLKQQQILTYTLIEKQAMMVSLVPTLELCDSNNKMEKVNCEYIFIVDCSGSMSDENKIGYARQAMSVFLKSLPIGSYFNIFRFGSTYEQFQKNQITIEYNEQTAKQANDYIQHLKADLGGTELYSVLSYFHKNPPQLNYSRQLFLLTDGEIDDVDKVLRLCHSITNTTRIFSFGLGSSPSRALVKGLARVTNGSYLFIPPKTHVDIAVARQIAKALEPCLVNLKVQCHFDNQELKDYRLSPKILPPIHAKQRLNIYIMLPKIIEGTLSGSIDFLTDQNDLLERVTLTATEPSSSQIATRLAAKSVITDLQMDDYNTQSSRQARFVEQQEADKKQELIDLSIQHQILSPFTAFIGVETRTEQEKVSANEIILREVPVEIRASESSSDYDACSPGYTYSGRMQMIVDSDDEDCDDEEECEEDCEDDELNLRSACYSHPALCEKLVLQSRAKRRCRRASRSRSRSRSPDRRRKSRSRSRSCSPERRRESRSRSPCGYSRRLSKDQDEDDSNSSDILRQIIALQNFGGLWSINNLEQIILLLQKNSISKDMDLKKILNDYKAKDNNVILSMIIMFIFLKYFTNEELLWKPIIKKSVKAMENQLGKQEYHHISDQIKLLV